MKLRKGQRKVKVDGYLRFAILEAKTHAMQIEVLPFLTFVQIVKKQPHISGTICYAADDGYGYIWFFPLPNKACTVRLRIVKETEV